MNVFKLMTKMHIFFEHKLKIGGQKNVFENEINK